MNRPRIGAYLVDSVTRKILGDIEFYDVSFAHLLKEKIPDLIFVGEMGDDPNRGNCSYCKHIEQRNKYNYGNYTGSYCDTCCWLDEGDYDNWQLKDYDALE